MQLPFLTAWKRWLAFSMAEVYRARPINYWQIWCCIIQIFLKSAPLFTYSTVLFTYLSLAKNNQSINQSMAINQSINQTNKQTSKNRNGFHPPVSFQDTTSNIKLHAEPYWAVLAGGSWNLWHLNFMNTPTCFKTEFIRGHFICRGPLSEKCSLFTSTHGK